MNNQSKNLHLFIGISLLLALLAIIIGLIFSPFIVNVYSIGGKDYIYQIYFYGYWKHFMNGELWYEGGNLYLTNFKVLSPILIIIGMTLTLIFLSCLGFNLKPNQQSNNQTKRLFGSLTSAAGFVGILGILWQIPYFISFKANNSEAIFGFGFIFGMLFFIIICISGAIIAIISKPNLRT